MKIKRVLVTGGTGYLGQKIVEMLLESQVAVTVMTRGTKLISENRKSNVDLLTLPYGNESFERILNRREIELVVHCATNYGRNQSSPSEICYTNLIMPLELLHAGSNVGIKHFINTDTILDKRINGYSLSKAHFKEWLEMYASKLHCINVSLEHFYGPGDNTTKFVSNIVRALIGNVHEIDLTQGEQKRDFIYIDDVVSAFKAIISDLGDDHLIGFDSFEVGTEKTITIKEFVEKAKLISGNKKSILNFGALPYRENEIMDSKVDASNLKKLGWFPKFDIDEGLKETFSKERIIQ